MKKNILDKSTKEIETDNMETEILKDHPFDPKFIFLETPKWENLDNSSKKIFNKLRKKLKNNITEYYEPSSFEKIFEYHQIIMETDMAHNLSFFYEKNKIKIGKKLKEAIERGLRYKAKDYAEAIDSIEDIYDGIKEIFHYVHGIITPSTTGIAPIGLANTGSPEFCTIWTFLGMPSISLPILKGLNNMPLGVQLVGEKNDDIRFLRSANWLLKKNKLIK
jgi:Asp-tRNA(Asn)/Glu-tRNA(Gln) amidotransferase A subunit family amidase